MDSSTSWATSSDTARPSCLIPLSRSCLVSSEVLEPVLVRDRLEPLSSSTKRRCAAKTFASRLLRLNVRNFRNAKYARERQTSANSSGLHTLLDAAHGLQDFVGDILNPSLHLAHSRPENPSAHLLNSGWAAAGPDPLAEVGRSTCCGQAAAIGHFNT